MALQGSVAMSKELGRLVKLASLAEWPPDLDWAHPPRKWGKRSELWHREMALRFLKERAGPGAAKVENCMLGTSLFIYFPIYSGSHPAWAGLECLA